MAENWTGDHWSTDNDPTIWTCCWWIITIHRCLSRHKILTSQVVALLWVRWNRWVLLASNALLHYLLPERGNNDTIRSLRIPIPFCQSESTQISLTNLSCLLSEKLHIDTISQLISCMLWVTDALFYCVMYNPAFELLYAINQLLFIQLIIRPILTNYQWGAFWSCSMEIVAGSSCWWRFGAVGSDVGQINEVTLRRARLVLGWVTVWGFNSWCGKFVSV